MVNPLVSIVTVTLNSARHLRKTMESVLSQNYEPLEYWIIDGGSKDQSIEIAASFQDSRIRLISEPDRGIADAMNKGIRLAQGEIIGILHSDDSYKVNAIAESVRALAESDRSWSYGQIEYINKRGEYLYTAGQPFDLEQMKKFMVVTHPSMFVRKSLYEKYGNFNLQYNLAMDYDLCLRFALKNPPIYIPQIIARMSLGGASSKNFRAECSAATEVYLIKNNLLPQYKGQNFARWLWDITKIAIRNTVMCLPWGSALVHLGRTIVNPALLETRRP